MRLYRIFRKEHQTTEPLSGLGSTFVDGRWHCKAPDLFLVYASDSLALAAKEKLVHIFGDLPPEATKSVLTDAKFLYSEISLDLELETYEGNFERQNEEDTRRYASEWLADSKRPPLLKIPSVTCPMGHNFLLNPRHPAFSLDKVEIKTEAFHFDPRFSLFDKLPT